MELVGDLTPATAVFGSVAMNGDEYVRCNRCGFGGCDVRVSGCGCTLHSRCIAISNKSNLSTCPQCAKPTTGVVLFPLSYREIDEAQKSIATTGIVPTGSPGSRGRKRKSSDEAASGDKSTECRTGRWTTEEMLFCDKLIAAFESGKLPLTDGTKLNEFLGTMLKSKQSRLTKKMKNAKLSTKTYERMTGYLRDPREAREFSQAEEAFFLSIHCPLERAEIKFHMQKQWREQFSSLCVSAGQSLDADAWLTSVEDMDRRAREAKDAVRVARRRLMMGYALHSDSAAQENGVFIEKSNSDTQLDASHAEAAKLLGTEDTRDADELLSLLTQKTQVETEDDSLPVGDAVGKSSLLHSAPFLSKAISYIERHNVPFEHIDVWVPSFVPEETNGLVGDGPSCRLCFAGCATVESRFDPDRKAVIPLATEENFNLLAFGDYSQKFSFDVGCGLPGRIYQSGLPTWEQSVHNAPKGHFERCGGARQWGVKTVVGIPIASPNVGRIVVTLYSRYDREKDQDLVQRLSQEFTKLIPSPKWKLVVDIGQAENHETPAFDGATVSSQIDFFDGLMDEPDVDKKEEVISLLGKYMPADPSSSNYTYLEGFMSLRLMLLCPTKSVEDEELMRTILGSYASYTEGGRSKDDIALMLARDYLFLSAGAQQFHREPQLFEIGQTLTSSVPTAGPKGFSFFALPMSDTTPSSSFPNSPALAPINPGSGPDTLSIVSN